MDMSELLPLIIGAAVLPVWIIITLLLLRSEGGLWKATAFVIGAIAVRVVQGILFGFVFGQAGDAYGESGSTLIASTLLTLAGIVMLIVGVKKWRKEPDPDDPAPRWLTMLGELSPLKALGMGAGLMAVAMKQWVFTLSAIAVIEEAQLGRTGSALWYLGFVLAAQSLMLIPIIIYAIAPGRTGRVLEQAQGWLDRNNRVIMIALSLIFGAWFLWKGISGLLG